MQKNVINNHTSIDKLFNIVKSERPIIEKEIVEDEPMIEEEKPPAATSEIKEDAGEKTKLKTVDEAVEKITDEAAKETADFFIYALDFIQKNVFKFFAKKKLNKKAKSIAGENAIDRINVITAELKAARKAKKEPTTAYEGEDKLLKDLILEVEDFIKELDLDEDEEKMLKTPLKEMVKVKNIKLSPEMSLLMAAAMIASTRIGSLYAI